MKRHKTVMIQSYWRTLRLLSFLMHMLSMHIMF